MITGVFCLWRHQTNVKQSQSVRLLLLRISLRIQSSPVHVFAQCPPRHFWSARACDGSQFTPRLACVEHHRIRSRVHRIHGSRLGGNLGYRRVGRGVGSIGDIVGHVDIGWIGPVRLCQNVEVQAGQVLEILEPTIMKLTCASRQFPLRYR
jgi:hypothetical protein